MDGCKSIRTCLNHAFLHVALENPNRVAIVHVSSSPSELSSFQDEVLESESPPVYPGDVAYTYAELLGAVDALAQRILTFWKGTPAAKSSEGWLQDKASTEGICFGVEDCGHCRRVGILIGRSPDYIVSVLAVLKLGAAFVPLDPSWPKGRILAAVMDSKPYLLISCNRCIRPYFDKSFDLETVSRLFKVPVLCLPDGFIKEWKFSSERNEVTCYCHCRKNATYCYVMYTSGSTGTPKGVCGTEEGLVHRLEWMQAEYPYGLNDVALFKTATGFIDHLTETFGPLLGKSLLIIPHLKDSFRHPLVLLPYIKTYRISRLTAVPSLMRALLPALQTPEGKGAVKSMRVLVLSGEKLDFWLWEALHNIMQETTILNLYGSTELSGDCLYFDCRWLLEQVPILSDILEHGVPIGKQLPGCDLCMLSSTGDLALSVEEGELCIGGPVLAIGYLNNALYTSQRYMIAPNLESGSSDGDPKKLNGLGPRSNRMFKTGDYVRKLQDGNFIFLGRTDRTIKINGQRVALEEVERCLEDHPDVACAAVSYHRVDSNVHLVAYVVPEEKSKTHHLNYIADSSVIFDRKCDIHHKTLTDTLRVWLNTRLLPVMVPREFLLLKALPVTGSGKVDYKALLNIALPKLNVNQVSDGEQEWIKSVQEVFEQVLMISNISPFDDFFSLGGTSISAAHVAYALGIDLGLLYTHCSPLSLAAVLKGTENKNLYRKRSFEEEAEAFMAVKNLKHKDEDTSWGMIGSLEHEDTEVELVLTDNDSSLGLQNIKDKDADSNLKSNPAYVGSSSHVLAGSLLQFTNHKPPSLWPFGICISKPVALLRCNKFMSLGQDTETTSLKFFYLLPTSLLVNCSLHLFVLWKQQLDACVDASPILIQSKNNWHLLIGSHAHNFVCLDAASGQLKWEIALGGRIESTAAVTHDFKQVVFGCYDNFIYFSDCESGKLVWKFQTRAEVKCQPTVDVRTGLIWCGSHDHNIYVLDALRQSLVWQYDCGGSIFGAATHDTVRCMTYVATTRGTIVAVMSKISVPRVSWTYTCGAPIFGSPALDLLTGNVICTLVTGTVVALTSDGSLAWEVNTNGPIFAGACLSSALPTQVLVCSRDGWMYSYRVVDGQCLWKHRIGEPIVSSAYVDEGFELVYEEHKENSVHDHKYRLVCVCGTSGSIHVLQVYSGSTVYLNVGNVNRKTVSDTAEASAFENYFSTVFFPMSQLVAGFKLPGDVFSSPIMLQGRIFVGCRDNNVYCIQLAGFEELLQDATQESNDTISNSIKT